MAGFLLIVLFTAFGISLVKDVMLAKELFYSAKSNLTTATGLAKNAGFTESEAHFSRAGSDFQEARSVMNRPVFKVAAHIPGFDQNIHALTVMGSAGIQVARAGQSLCQASMKFPLNNGQLDFGLTNKKIDLDPFMAAQSFAERSDHHARLAVAECKKIPSTGLIPPIRDARQTLEKEVIKLKRLTSTISAVLAVLPGAAGAQEKRRYFLAVQNNAELRATGGLIGCYGIMTVEDGRFSLDNFDKITVLQKRDQPVEAPRDFIDRYGCFKATRIWSNANMSPDFPTVGKVLLGLYKSNVGVDLDGVISIDPVGLQYLLEATGPVWVPEAAIRLDASNVVNWTLIEAYNRYQGEERQDFLTDVARAVWEKILSGKITDKAKLIDQLSLALKDKHMMLFDANEEEQKVFNDLGYAGTLIHTTCDFLQIVMQNHGANKVDVYLYEDVDYLLSVNKDGSAHAKVTVKIANRAPKSGLPLYVAGGDPLGAKGGSSRTYLSLYAPRDAQLMSVTVDGKPGDPDVGHEKDKAVFSQYLYVAPGTSSVTSFTYDLPQVLKSNGETIDYILDWQAQPIINHARITANIELPAGFSVLHLPAGAQKQGRKVSLNKTLVRDERLAVSLRVVPDMSN